jgi:hypothetical protein
MPVLLIVPLVAGDVRRSRGKKAQVGTVFRKSIFLR